jgi:predicted ATP-grasp superfamily ATP-dependent carboligase
MTSGAPGSAFTSFLAEWRPSPRAIVIVAIVSDGSWILVTDHGYSQSRTALATVRALAMAGFRPAVTVADSWTLAAASRYCSRRVTVPPGGGPRYAAAVREELAARPYACVLPTSDAALLALGAPGARFVDKLSLGRMGRRAGLATVPTRSFAGADELLAAAHKLTFPAVIKPAMSQFRAFRVDGPEGLRRDLPSSGPLLVQPYIRDPLRAMSGVVRGGQLVAAVHQRYLRIWPADCGGASAAMTISPDLELEEQVLRLLAGYEGIFMVQLAGPYLLDLNARPYGSLPLAVAAGANLVAIHCRLLLGQEPPALTIRARPSVRYRWLEGDVRSLAAELRRGRIGPRFALGALLPRPGTAPSTETWRDPAPALVRLLYALARITRRGGRRLRGPGPSPVNASR